MKKIIKSMFCTALFSITAASCFAVYKISDDELLLINKERACISSHTQEGVKREDIIVRNGVCYLIYENKDTFKRKKLYNGAYL